MRTAYSDWCVCVPQQATEGPCNVPSPHLWNRVERAKWDVWKQVLSMHVPAALCMSCGCDESLCSCAFLESARAELAFLSTQPQLGNTSKIESMFLYTRSVEEACPNWAQWKGLAPDIAAALGLESPAVGSATAADACALPPPFTAEDSCELILNVKRPCGA